MFSHRNLFFLATLDDEGVRLKRVSKNDSKSLLAWDVARKTTSTVSRTVEAPQEVRQSEMPDELYSMKNYKWSDQKKKQYAGVCPFGIAEEVRVSVSPIGTVKKRVPVSLANFVGWVRSKMTKQIVGQWLDFAFF